MRAACQVAEIGWRLVVTVMAGTMMVGSIAAGAAFFVAIPTAMLLMSTLADDTPRGSR